ncbi:MAG: metallophosphoesterase family protein [Rhodobiaceae bacterium]|nr:metallophosphoesterase family protein [Rhodobiaceae bacterium]
MTGARAGFAGPGRPGDRVLVFGGPYSNLQALRAMRARAAGLAIAPANALCTGDIAAYGADPAAVCDLMRDWGCAVVMGNCEEQFAAAAPDCGCGFDDGSACDALSRQWYAHALSALDDGQRAWMCTLPRRIDFTLGELRCTAIHGGATRINRFIFPSTPAEEKRREADILAADLVIAGHSGLPFTQVLGAGRAWHNAGALGLPANDGTPDVWYSLLTPDGGGLAISHHRLAYDHGGAAKALRAARPGDPYAGALESGLWPSLDILPEAERALTGRRLDPAGVFLSSPIIAGAGT